VRDVSLRTDGQLLRATAAGDAEAFAELMARHAKRVIDFAASILRDPRDAEDAAQDALIDAYRSAAEFDGRANAGPWLLGIAYNRCRRRLRQRAGRDISLDDLAESSADVPGDAQPTSEAVGDSVVTRIDVSRALAGLPAEYRIPIVLRFQQDLSYAEIADALEISDSAAAMRLHRGRAMLRERLRHLHAGEEEGGSE
jgi:RNA polymerase sigma-70 factor (ECF subfamily)